MTHMTARLADGSEMHEVQEVVEGSHGVHLKKEVQGGGVDRVAYVPYGKLDHVYMDE